MRRAGRRAAFGPGLRRSKPDVVGFSVVTPGYPVARRQIQRLRRQRPDLPIVVGGIHASLFPEDFLADGADAVVVGDGCEPMVALVDRIRRGLPWDDVPGLGRAAHAREAGSFTHTPRRSDLPA